MTAIEIECLCGRMQMVAKDPVTGGGLRVTLYAGNCAGCGRRISAGIGAPPSRRDAPFPPEVLADAHQERLPIVEGRARAARAVRARGGGA